VAYAGPAACNDAKFKFGDDGPVRSQHRPQPPERGSAAGAAAAAAGAGINGTQERVILGDKNGLAPSLRPQERRLQPPERASTERRSV
jgi:hypothetical protein